MRVAIITESFPPDVNGVAHCVLRVAELLASSGHHPLRHRPAAGRGLSGTRKPPTRSPVVRVPAVPLPGYPGFRLGLPGRPVRAALIRHRAELVHLASPVVLGAHGAAVARRLTLPTIAVYQTDLPSYARAYRLGRARRGVRPGGGCARHPQRRRPHAGPVHGRPRPACSGQGIENVWLWGRGVDTRRFHPAKRSPQIRAELAPDGELIAGYVGRLATEKRVDLLAGITALDGVRWSSSAPVRPRPRCASRCRAPSSSASAGARNSRPSTPASTCSCTAVRSRRSARRCRRRPRAVLPVVAPAAGAARPGSGRGDRIPGVAVGCRGVHGRGGPAGRRPGDTRGVRRGRAARVLAGLARADRGADRAPRRSAIDRAVRAARGPGNRPRSRYEDRPAGQLRRAALGRAATSLDELGAGYLAAGHEPVLVIPGERDGDERCAQGRVITLRAPGCRSPAGTGCCGTGGAWPGCWPRCGRMPWRCRTGPRCAGPGRGPASTACRPSWSRTRASPRCWC